LAYEVQKSSDGINFTTVATMNAVNTRSIYEYTDRQGGAGTLYYRLGFAGVATDTYSTIAVIKNETNTTPPQIWPSLIQGQQANLYISNVSTAAETLPLLIIDDQGRVRIHTTVTTIPGSNRIPLNLSSLGRGVYFVQAGQWKAVPFEKR
jgi:hypothetical protein